MALPPRSVALKMSTTSASARFRTPSGRARVSPVRSLTFEASPMSLRFKARNLVLQSPTHRRRDFACRLLNVLVATTGIVLTAPLMLLIAVVVKASSPGPIVFRQRRVGLDRRRPRDSESLSHRRDSDHGGKVFTMYKFRTMCRDDGTNRERWASRNDPRITLVGKVLRATRLDELPQFFNVLRGDMNIVGPRPEQPAIFQEIHRELGRRYRSRQRVLPGITGLAQVKQGYDMDLDGVRRKVELDLEYISQRSATRDIEIMMKTVPVMVFRRVWK